MLLAKQSSVLSYAICQNFADNQDIYPHIFKNFPHIFKNFPLEKRACL